MSQPDFRTDHNVYILGAGFSNDAGLPLVSNFLQKMREAVSWLYEKQRTTEKSSIEKVLEFRLKAGSAAHRIDIDPDNIEELFSLASAQSGSKMISDIKTAIAATLDYAKETTEQKPVMMTVDTSKVTNVPAMWIKNKEVVPGTSIYRYEVPIYHCCLGILTGHFSPKSDERQNTIITFNYDTVVEEALYDLSIPFWYGFNPKSVNYDPSYRSKANSKLQILKMHGSLNWGLPGKQGGKTTEYGTYSDLRNAKADLVILPPTWRKEFEGRLTNVWDKAIAAIKTATRIIVLGFSVPPTDIHFKYLLAAGLQENISLEKVIFLDKNTDRIKSRVESILRKELSDRDVVHFIMKEISSLVSRDDIKIRTDIGRVLDLQSYQLF